MAPRPTTITPESFTGTRCGHMVSAGLMSYQCERQQGHTAVPPEDPEPHYVPESRGAVVVWQAWAQRQQAKAEAANPVLTALESPCPDCGGVLIVTDDADTAKCSADTCGYMVAISEPGEIRPVLTEEEFAALNRSTDNGEEPDVEEQPPYEEYLRASAALDEQLLEEKVPDAFEFAIDPTIADPEVPEPYYAPEGQVATAVDEEGVQHPIIRRFGAEDPTPIVHIDAEEDEGEDPVRFAALRLAGSVDDLMSSQPTKQRDGDQPLPGPGVECVQDVIIAAMQESKRVGTERYGQPLMTFNGRKGFQDVVEELRDAFVYGSEILREAEADRETLIGVVGRALQIDPDIDPVAEQAVDSIMGWVTGQRLTAPRD